ncbi:MAG: exodeoxyribonuclease I [Methylococcales bacterium]
MTNPTFFWHDYETWGADPRKDRAAQFAGVRTDYDFNVVDDPLIIYCKPATDVLPHPEACLITGITPQLAEQKGVSEALFVDMIHEQLSQPETCTLGYNSLRFDDEVTRNALYRNFYDPYAREWQNGNSRWDLIDIARAARALRPEGIQWPVDESGKPSFRLEQLTKDNDITHESAHDALSDVYATIAIAKLIRKAQPKLYDFLFQHRNKTKALDLLQLGSFKPVVHISGKYPALKNCLAIVLPICKHPTNTNGVIVYDLSIDPTPMLSLSVEDIKQRIFTATVDLPEGVERIPLKTVHINKCPVLAPISVIRPADAQRLHIDLAECRAKVEKIKAAVDLPEKLAAVFSDNTYESESKSDPDLALYSGGFFSAADKQKMAKIRHLATDKIANSQFHFEDNRLPEMLFRYRARNFPETLSTDEKLQWRQFCINRLTGVEPGASITLDNYFTCLNDKRHEQNANNAILDALEDYAKDKMRHLGMPFLDSNFT